MTKSPNQIGSFEPPGPHELAFDARTILLGRWEAAHVVINDPLVSTLHAAILAVEGRWQVRDLGSRNGTFVNGARVSEVVIRPGDTLKLGSTVFRFDPRASKEDATAAAPPRRSVHLDPDATLTINMPSDPTDALLASAVREPRALSALLTLSNLIELAPPRSELVSQTLAMIADTVLARGATLVRGSKDLVPEATWGEEKALPAARDELIQDAIARRQATMSSLGDAGFGAALPLLARGGTIGCLYAERGTPFPRRDLELLSICATKFALALENDELTERLKRSNAHLETEVARRTAVIQDLSEQRRDLLGMVAHDVRGALTFVKLLADARALRSEGAQDPVALEALEQIDLRAGKTIELLASLLDTQAVEDGRIALRLESVDLVALVKDLLVPLERWAKGRNLSLVVDGEAPVVARTDPARFEQVIQNLVANAIKHTRAGTITVSVAARDGRARVRVTDSGDGIPAEVLARVFKPVTVMDTRNGRPRVGLGLAIVHRLVSLLGGTISVESAPGKGTTFHLEVPLGP